MRAFGFAAPFGAQDMSLGLSLAVGKSTTPTAAALRRRPSSNAMARRRSPKMGRGLQRVVGADLHYLLRHATALAMVRLRSERPRGSVHPEAQGSSVCDVRAERDRREAVGRETERRGAKVDDALLEPEGVTTQPTPCITLRALNGHRRAVCDGRLAAPPEGHGWAHGSVRCEQLRRQRKGCSKKRRVRRELACIYADVHR